MKIQSNNRFDQFPEIPGNPAPIFIIGAGGIVRDAHLPAYTMAGFVVGGIYDLDADKTELLKSRFSVIPEI